MDAEQILQSLMPLNNFLHQPIAQIYTFVLWISQPTLSLHGYHSPLHPLLSIKNDCNHDLAFGKAKESLTSSPTLSFFDVGRQTRLCTDASCQGLGFILQQRQGGNWSKLSSVRNKQQARLVVYWPSIDNDIDNVILDCKQCQDFLPAN